MTLATPRRTDPVLSAKADALLQLLERDCRWCTLDRDAYEHFADYGINRAEANRCLNLLAQDDLIRIGSTRSGYTRVELLGGDEQ